MLVEAYRYKPKNFSIANPSVQRSSNRVAANRRSRMDPCSSDFVEHTRHLFVDVAQGSAIATGQRPARRAVFRKLHGIAHGRMKIGSACPLELRHGIFACEDYDLWLRFSSDVAPEAPDSGNGTIGVAMKLFGISGPTLATVDPQSPTADLLLQNHDVFFVDTGHDMCVFTDLALKGRIQDWFADHPETKTILAEMQKREESVLTATYWSVLPYACGPGVAVKYSLSPEATGGTRAPDDDPNRLRSDLAVRLASGEAAFTLEIQRPLPGQALPIDRATQRWAEASDRVRDRGGRPDAWHRAGPSPSSDLVPVGRSHAGPQARVARPDARRRERFFRPSVTR
jgi:hypothetical protein